MKFTALLHHLTVDQLRESFYSLKRKAAPGVDGVTWQEYEIGVEDRLVDLHGRVHRGAYRAKPSRRVYIEKADGRQRPLGVAALEDKLVQQAVATILNQIYEEDFLASRMDFAPGRSQHDALDALSYALLPCVPWAPSHPFHVMPPRITRNSHRPRASDRTMVDFESPFACRSRKLDGTANSPEDTHQNGKSNFSSEAKLQWAGSREKMSTPAAG